MNSSGFDVNFLGATRQYNAQNPWLELRLGEPHAGFSYNPTEQAVLTPLVQSSDVDLQFVPNETGYVGASFALLGEYETATAHAECQQLMIVAPTSADLERPPSYYADALATAARDLDLGPRYTVVTAFVNPADTGSVDGLTPSKPGSSTLMGAEFAVSADTTLTEPKNTWIHEYVHTRQATTRYDWVSEGSATYFATTHWAKQNFLGRIRVDGFYANRANQSGNLSPSIRSGNIPYARGSFFFTSIAESLHGTNTTVEDVYRTVNTDRYQAALNNRNTLPADSEAFSETASRLTGKDLSYPNPYDQQLPVEYYSPHWFVNLFGNSLYYVHLLPGTLALILIYIGLDRVDMT